MNIITSSRDKKCKLCLKKKYNQIMEYDLEINMIWNSILINHISAADHNLGDIILAKVQ